MSENNFNNVRKIVENRAKNNWVDTEIAYQDIPYEVKKNTPYIALNILFGESENAGLGSMNNMQAPIRENGVLLIEVHVPSNKGTDQVLSIAGNIRALYQNTDENGLAFYAGSINRIGESSDQLQYNVEIPFFYQ